MIRCHIYGRVHMPSSPANSGNGLARRSRASSTYSALMSQPTKRRAVRAGQTKLKPPTLEFGALTDVDARHLGVGGPICWNCKSHQADSACKIRLPIHATSGGTTAFPLRLTSCILYPFNNSRTRSPVAPPIASSAATISSACMCRSPFSMARQRRSLMPSRAAT